MLKEKKRMKIKTETITLILFCFFVTQGLGQSGLDLDSLREQIKFEQPSEDIYELLNTKFPILNMSTIDGQTFQTKSLMGKNTLINFWFTNCQPCLDEIPILNEISDELDSEDINFVAITFQDKEEINKFLKSNKFNFTQIINSRDIIETLGIKFYPKTIILDQEMNIVRIEKRIPANANDSEIECWKREMINSLIMN